MMTPEWNWFTKDGLPIYSRDWVPSLETKGVVCLVHGVGEHLGRFHLLGAMLAERGFVLAGFDIRGFGRSGGRRGHTPSLETYFDDLDLFLAHAAQRYPGLPCFLYGHSMGGILVLAYAPIRRPRVVGIIAASPGLRTSLQQQTRKVIMAKLLGKILPTLTLKHGLDPNQLSRNPRTVEEHRADPLVHPFITLAWGRSMLRAIDLVFCHAPEFPLPVLIMHGTEDQIAFPRGSQEAARLIPESKVTLKLWEGFKHELHADPENTKVFNTVVGWLDRQL